MTTTTTPLAVVHRLRDAMNAHDLDAMVELFAADFRGETPTTPDTSSTGNDTVRRNWAGIFARMPDFRIEVLRSTTDDDTVWAEVVYRGTGPDGGPFVSRGVIVFEVDDGRMTRNVLYVHPVVAGRPGLLEP